MAAPNSGYAQYPHQYGQGQEASYTDEPTAGFDGQTSDLQQSATPQPADPGRKKKRGYATQAFEFGAGSNAGMAGGPIPPGSGGVGVPQPSPGYGGYPQQEFQPGYASPTPAGYGAQGYPAPGQITGAAAAAAPAGVGGYQSPDQYYPSGAAPAAQGVSGITAGMQGMNMGGVPQPLQQQPQQQARLVLNQLYPTDLLNQPFNVSELDLPPPPCILPPNVSLSDGFGSHVAES